MLICETTKYFTLFLGRKTKRTDFLRQIYFNTVLAYVKRILSHLRLLFDNKVSRPLFHSLKSSLHFFWDMSKRHTFGILNDAVEVFCVFTGKYRYVFNSNCHNLLFLQR